MTIIDLLDLASPNRPHSKTDATLWARLMNAANIFRNSYVMTTGIINGQRKLISYEDERRTPSKGVDNAVPTALANLDLLRKISNADLARRKLERTLQRLKEKGIYETNMARLVTPVLTTPNSPSPKDEWFSSAWVTQNLISGIMHCGARAGFTEQTLDDEDWMAAIETAIILHYPEEVIDQTVQSYAVHLNELGSEIRLLAVLIHMVNNYEGLVELCRINAEKARCYDTLYERYSHLNAQHDALLKERESFSESKVDASELDQVRAAAEKRQHEDRMRIFALERQVDLLTQEKAHMEQLWADEIAAIEAEKEARQHEPEEGSEAEIEAVLTDEELYGHIELPEKNVMFLGGWPKLLRPIKERHPEWSFVNKEDKGRGTDRIDIVFFFYERISHKMVWRIYSEMRPDVKTIFIRQRNKDLMELEMKKGYAQVVLSRTQEARNPGDEE